MDNVTTEAPTLVESTQPKAYLVGRMVVTILLASFIMLGNGMTIYAVIRTRKLRKIPTNVYVVSLAIADTSVGFFINCIQTLHALTTDERAIRRSVCFARAPYYATIAVSTCTLLAIAVDRYVAIVHPLSYKRRMTTNRAIAVSSLVWIAQLCIVGGTSCYYGMVVPIGQILTGNLVDLLPSHILLGVVLPQVYLPVIGNIIVYAAIFVSIHTRKRVSDNSDNKKPDKMATAVTKMMMLILGYLLVAWLPYFCIAPLYGHDRVKPLWYVYLSQLSVLLLYTNSAVNPIIYSWMNRDFREAYKRILKCRRAAPTDESPNNTVKTDTAE